jgi:fibronectin type 3 domain-containing protein
VNSTGTSSTYSSEVSAKPIAIPGTPTGFVAFTNGNYIQFNWNASSGATSYNLYRSTTAGGEGSSPTYTGVTSTFIDTGITGGVTYYYKVTAVNASGESAKSTESSAVAPTIPPAPTGLAVGALTATTAYLSWNAVSGAADYGVFVSLTSGSEATATPTVISGTSGTISSLVGGTTYYAIVETFTNAGTYSGFSNEVTFTTVIASVTNLTATWTSGSPVLSWTGSSGATSYTIQRQLNFSGAPTTIGSTTGTTYTDSTASAQPAGTVFTYFVVATCAASTDPTPPSVAIQAPLTAPNPVTATGAYESINLAWPAPAGGNQYVVKRSTTSGGPYSIVNNGQFGTTGTPVTFTDPGLSDNTTYYYIVGAEYFNGTGNYAETDSSEAAATTAPVTPPSLTATASTYRGVVLTWPASPGATRYNIYESAVSGGVNGQYTNVGSSTSATCTVTGLADSTTYYFVVNAQNSAGTVSNNSPEANATTWPPTPYLTGVTGNATVTLNWTAVAGVLGYTVYRSTWNEFGFTKISGMTLLSGTSYIDNTVSNGVEYFYVVTYTNSYGESVYSNVVDATPNTTSSGNAIYQIDSGGPAVGSWVADKFTTCPSTYSTTNTIDISKAINPAPAAVYQTCDVCNLPFSYNITGLTPNAAYVVRLHFADAWDTLPGQRVMSIAIQGITVAAAWDPIQAAGGPNIATVAQFNANADSSGNIAILFTGVTAYPLVNGVEIDGGSAVPTEPIGLHAMPGHAQIMLGWSGYAGVTGYNVYRGTATGGPYTLITSSPVAGPTYTDTTAVNSTTYYYVVTAVNSVGESLRSNEAYATPAAVNASCYRINCGGPNVGNWTGQTSGYTFATTSTPSLAGLSNPAPAAVYQTSDNGSHTMAFLTPGANYVLRLHLDSYAVSSNTDVLSVFVNGGQVLNNFDVRSDSGATGKAVIEQFNVTPDSNGNIAITLSNVLGNGGLCGIELLTDSLPPSQPTHLIAWRGNTQVTLNWPPQIGSTNYNVYRSTSSGGPYTRIATSVNTLAYTSMTYSDPTVANDYYVVTAVNSTGESGYSNQAYPAAPFTLTANPTTIHCSNGSSVTSHITAVSTTDFLGTVNFTGSGTGSGVSALLYPSSGLLQLSNLNDISITVATSLQICVNGAANGTYPLTVTGTSGDYTSSTTVNLVTP